MLSLIIKVWIYSGLLLLLFISTSSVNSQETQHFNFEISSRVLDEVTNFFDVIHRCVDRFIAFQVRTPGVDVAGTKKIASVVNTFHVKNYSNRSV